MKIIYFNYQKILITLIIIPLLTLVGIFIFSIEVNAENSSINNPVFTSSTSSASENVITSDTITKPSIINFFTENTSEYGGSVKLTWQTEGSTYVDYFWSGYGIGLIDAKTGMKAGGNLPASGVLYLKTTNGTRNDSMAEIYMTPYYKNNTFFRAGNQRIITFKVNASSVSPIINRLEPEYIIKGNTLIIHGLGFSAKDNHISIFKSEYGAKSLITDSSDMETLRIQMPEILDYSSEEFRGVKQMKTIPGQYQIVVSNSNGKSNVFQFYVTETNNKIIESSIVSTSSINMKKSIPNIPVEKIPTLPLNKKAEQPLIIKNKPSITSTPVTEKIPQNDTVTIKSTKSLWGRFLNIFHF